MTVKIYTTSICPYCIRAKMWLKGKKIEFEEIELDDPEERAAFYEKVGNGVRTVPQIFFGEERIGGYSDLIESDIVDRFHKEAE